MEKRRLAQIIDHLLNKHHKYLRDVMPRIKKDLSSMKTLPLEGDLKKKVDSVGEILQDIGMDIDQHLMKEENILFPTICDMEEAASSGAAGGSMGCGVQGPVNQMLYEHNTIKESLAHMEKDIQDISTLIRETGHGEKDFVQGLIKNSLEMKADLLEHIRIEEEDLFPSAMSLESEMGE